MSAFEFGPFVLDAAKRSLLRAGVPQSLTPKAFDMLLLLVEQRERVVSKDELLKTLWPGMFVDEANLSQQVFVLRRTLNGDSAGPDYIATIPRRGYRFVADVIERSEPETPAGPSSRPAARPPGRWLNPVLAGFLVLGATAAFGILWRLRSEAPDPRILAVTALPGVEQSPNISPDGNFVAFLWVAPGATGPDIWIKAVDSDAKRQLTNTPAAETQLAWSPDGSEIAFVRAGQGVFIMSALDGQEHEHKVSATGSMVGWTRDGRSLLVRDQVDGGPPFGIFEITIKTGQRRPITRAPSGIGDWTFEVSPDGRTLAFVRYERPGISDVYVVPMAGGQPPRRRTDWNKTISRVVWMPDGRDLVYAVAEAPGLGQSLFRIRADDERLERGTRALHVNVRWPSVSRPRQDGSVRLAFIKDLTDVGLRLVDLQALSAGDVLGVSRFSDSTHVDFPGRFSRNGEQIAFLSDRNGWAEAWVAKLDGSGLRQVTTLKADELQIGGWSPDDRRIVVDAAVDGNSDLYIVNLDGAPPFRLTESPSLDLKADWSADGRWIYFSSDRSGGPEIWKVSADGGPAIQVTRQGGLDVQEGPDRRTLYYLDNRANTLKQVPVDGGEEIVVLDGVRFGFGLWSVTEHGIAFLAAERESDAIDFYSFSERRVGRLGRLPFQVRRGGLGGLVVRRDARWALVSVTDQQESDIMVADGFR